MSPKLATSDKSGATVLGASPRLTKSALQAYRKAMGEKGGASTDGMFDSIPSISEPDRRHRDRRRRSPELRTVRKTSKSLGRSTQWSDLSDGFMKTFYDQDYKPVGKKYNSLRPRSWAHMRRSISPPRPRRKHRKSDDGQSTPTKRSESKKWRQYRKRRQTQMNHQRQRALACENMRKRRNVRAVGRAAYKTANLNAFSDGSSFAKGESSPEDVPPPGASNQPYILPDWLPETHTSITDPREVAKFMASASYIISVGGTAVPDLNYGVVFIPFGEERLFFSQADHGLSAEHKRAITARKKEEFYHGEKEWIVNSSLMTDSMDSDVFRFYDERFAKQQWEKDREAQIATANGLVMNEKGNWVPDPGPSCCDKLNARLQSLMRHQQERHEEELRKLALKVLDSQISNTAEQFEQGIRDVIYQGSETTDDQADQDTSLPDQPPSSQTGPGSGCCAQPNICLTDEMDEMAKMYEKAFEGRI